MSDERIAELRRSVAATGDPRERYRYRTALLRAGRGSEAGLEPGDTVTVDEIEYPWVNGSWRGVLVWVGERDDKLVRPSEEPSYRVRPDPRQLASGLYLTRQDRVTLEAPVEPGGNDG